MGLIEKIAMFFFNLARKKTAAPFRIKISKERIVDYYFSDNRTEDFKDGTVTPISSIYYQDKFGKPLQIVAEGFGNLNIYSEFPENQDLPEISSTYASLLTAHENLKQLLTWKKPRFNMGTIILAVIVLAILLGLGYMLLQNQQLLSELPQQIGKNVGDAIAPLKDNTVVAGG